MQLEILLLNILEKKEKMVKANIEKLTDELIEGGIIIPNQLQNVKFRFLRLQKKKKKPIAE